MKLILSILIILVATCNCINLERTKNIRQKKSTTKGILDSIFQWRTAYFDVTKGNSQTKFKFKAEISGNGQGILLQKDLAEPKTDKIDFVKNIIYFDDDENDQNEKQPMIDYRQIKNCLFTDTTGGGWNDNYSFKFVASTAEGNPNKNTDYNVEIDYRLGSGTFGGVSIEKTIMQITKDCKARQADVKSKKQNLQNSGDKYAKDLEQQNQGQEELETQVAEAKDLKEAKNTSSQQLDESKKATEKAKQTRQSQFDSLQELQKQTENAQNQYSEVSKDLENIQQAIDELNQQINGAEGDHKESAQQLQSAQEELEKAQATHAKALQALKLAEKELKAAENSHDEAEENEDLKKETLNDLDLEINDQQKALDEKSEQKISVKSELEKAQQEEDQASQELKRAEKLLENATQLMIQFQDQDSQLDQDLGEAQENVKSLGEKHAQQVKNSENSQNNFEENGNKLIEAAGRTENKVKQAKKLVKQNQHKKPISEVVVQDSDKKRALKRH